MCDLFKQEGKKCIALSLDDVYLTGKEQEELAQKHEHNKLLEFRGNGRSPQYSTFHHLFLPYSNVCADIVLP